MELADPQRSYAVLIGSATYGAEALDNLPAVANNLSRLADLLQDPMVWGLPAERCVRLAEPADPTAVLRAIHIAARAAEDTLLVYYAGHGLSDEGGLLLTLPDTVPEEPYTAVEFDAVRREVLRAPRDTNRIVILDCCYSGRALAGGMSGSAAPVEMAEQSRIAGSYLLTASAATRKALSPPGETYTAFTGELIRLLEDGMPGGETFIEVSRIYERLYTELRSKRRPLPQQRLSNTGRSLAFARNRYAGAAAGAGQAGTGWPPVPGGPPRPPERFGAAPTAVPAVLQLPDEWRPVLRGRPRVIADFAAGLRERHKDSDADRFLLRAGESRPAQEVAALAAMLFADARLEDVTVVIAAMVGRAPETVAACTEALHALDGAQPVINALGTASAAQPPQQVAAVIRALQARGHPGDATRLMESAAARRRQSDELIELIGALWSAELEDEADGALAMAATDSAEEAVRLADALLTMGRQEKAFELYLRAADVVVQRPPGELTVILRAMEEAGHGDSAGALLVVALGGADGPEAVAELCEALWSAGMEAQAQAVLDRGFATLGPSGVVELADLLRGNDRDDAVLALLGAAALASPVEATAGFVDALRGMGRPLDANTLLAAVAERPPKEMAFFLRWLEERGRTRDRERLLAALGRRPVRSRLGVFEVPGLRPGDYDDLVVPLLGAPEAEFAEVVRMLRGFEGPAVLVGLLSYLVSTDPDLALARLPELDRSQLAPEAAVLAALLTRDVLMARPDPEPVAGLASRRIAERPKDDEVREVVAGRSAPVELRAYAMGALSAVGRGGQVLAALSRSTAGLSLDEIVGWLAAIRRADLTDCAHVVIRDAGRYSAFAIASLITALHEAGLTDYATYTLRESASTLGSERAAKLARALAVTAPDSASPDPAPESASPDPAPESASPGPAPESAPLDSAPPDSFGAPGDGAPAGGVPGKTGKTGLPRVPGRPGGTGDPAGTAGA
jgi:tetratricopeptide (TPR) repeat protein